MPYDRIDLPDGTVMIVCSRGSRGRTRVTHQKCREKGCGTDSIALCDYKVQDGPRAGQTCDRAMCVAHRGPVGEDLDYCPAHMAVLLEWMTDPPEQLELV